MKPWFVASLIFLGSISSWAEASHRVALKKGWSSSAEYVVSTDLLEQEKPRLFTHFAKACTAYGFRLANMISACGSFAYRTLEREIVRTQEEEPYFEVQDINLVYTQKASENKKQKLLYYGAVYFPTSTNSRFEGHIAHPAAGLSHLYYFRDSYLIKSRATFAHLINTYDYSPVTNGVNPGSSFSISQLHQIFISYTTALQFEGSIKRTIYLDGSSTDDFTLGHGLGLVHQRGSVSVSFFYENGGHSMNQNIEQWYIDRARQIVSIGFGYEF